MHMQLVIYVASIAKEKSTKKTFRRKTAISGIRNSFTLVTWHDMMFKLPAAQDL